MTRKFKTAGVLMAVVAMFALTASSASALFTSNLTANSATATSTADVFDVFGSIVKCTNNTFQVGKYNTTKEKEPGKHVEAHFPTETLTVVPTYNNCNPGLPATVNFTGCDFVFHTPSSGPLTASLPCPASVTGADITIFSASDHASALCHIVVTPFTVPKGGLTATNNGSHVLVKGTVENITATQERTSIFCSAGTHTSTAKYTIQAEGITIKGTPGSTVSVS